MTAPRPHCATPLRAAALVLLAFTACNRSFHNPAEALQAGEVTGRVVAPEGGPAAGVALSLRGSAFEQVTRPSGRFSLVPLPAGHHVLLVRQGLDRAALREIDVGYGSDGQVEGALLGDLELPRASALSGSLTAAFGAPSGVVVDETTGTSAFLASSTFHLAPLPVGTHRIAAATHDAFGTWVAGPLAVTITADEAGIDKELTPLLLRRAEGTGVLHLRVRSQVDGLDARDAIVTVTDADQVAQAVPAPDSNGDRDLTLPEGPYLVEVRAPAGVTDVPAPPRRFAVVLDGEIADLGTFLLANDASIEAAQLACHDDADCAPGACTAGLCTGYTAPAAVPVGVPACIDPATASCWLADAPCDLPGGLGPAVCKENPLGATASFLCVPCGTSCTPDGAVTLSASCP